MDTPEPSPRTHSAAPGARPRAARAGARAGCTGAWATLALTLIALLPLAFALMEHGDCYGGGPVLRDAVAWPDAGDWGDCCAELRTRPASALARALLGSEHLWFLFAPVALAFARILGWIRARGAGALAGSVVALHLATLALGERSIGGAFRTMGVEALVLVPFTYGLAWFVAARFERAPPGPPRAVSTRWPAVAAALAVIGVPAWLLLAVAHPGPDGIPEEPAVRRGCSAG